MDLLVPLLAGFQFSAGATVLFLIRHHKPSIKFNILAGVQISLNYKHYILAGVQISLNYKHYILAGVQISLGIEPL
jgi:hypothetical protein